jgi:hypothetical protein
LKPEFVILFNGIGIIGNGWIGLKAVNIRIGLKLITSKEFVPKEQYLVYLVTFKAILSKGNIYV